MKVVLAMALIAIGSFESDEGPPAGMRQAQHSDFNFASALNSPCTPTKSRRGPDPALAEECRQWSEPQYFHGVWEVGFEVSNFTFMGKMDCHKMRDRSCIELRGKTLPWPGRWDCNREFELRFIGRRSLHPLAGHMGSPTFAVTVDRVIDAKRLPAPYNWVCPSDPDKDAE